MSLFRVGDKGDDVKQPDAQKSSMEQYRSIGGSRSVIHRRSNDMAHFSNVRDSSKENMNEVLKHNMNDKKSMSGHGIYVPGSARSTVLQQGTRYVSLNCLTDEIGSDWCIKVRVHNVRGPSFYRNVNGSGLYMKFVIMDEEQSEMSMTAYKAKNCDTFKRLLQQNKVYHIEGAQVKRTKEEYKIYNTDFEIILNEYTIVRSCPDDPRIPRLTVNTAVSRYIHL